MAKGDHSDLFMIFHDKDDRPIDGESSDELSAFDPLSEKMLKGFDKKKVFEIDRFELSAEAEQDADDIREAIVKERHAKPAAGAKGAPAPRVQQVTGSIDDEVKKRMAQQKGPRVSGISFTRAVDTTSKAFLEKIAIGEGYKSATLVKRKATGGRSASRMLVAGEVYLRIEFEHVLITEVEWSDDDEEIKEDCKFICRKITIKYRPQLPDGTLGAVVSGSYEYKPKT
jgi:type VI protein secretion system component Hcp